MSNLNLRYKLTTALFIWTIVAPSCMTFRSSDKTMRRKFEEKGIQLQTHTVKIRGRNMHYAKTGSDTLPTLVFIHGTPGSWNAFAGYMQDKALRQEFRMISLDRPGFGYSDFGLPMNLQAQSTIITELLQYLGNGKPVHLVGHSLGGPLVVRLAVENPDYINSLVIISGSVDPELEKKEKWRPLLFNTPLNLLIPGAFNPSNRELWYLKKDLQLLKTEFSKVRCPVTFIHGDNDTWVPVSNVDYAKRLLVNSQHIDEHILTGGNHFIPWTRFAEIRNILLRLRNSEYASERPRPL